MDRICPTCRNRVGVKSNGKLFPHQRYIDGGGYGQDQDHTMVQCEGGDND